jgi:hypothetical protein
MRCALSGVLVRTLTAREQIRPAQGQDVRLLMVPLDLIDAVPLRPSAGPPIDVVQDSISPVFVDDGEDERGVRVGRPDRPAR